MPSATLATFHAGFHVSGWKDDMDMHSFWPVANRPFGVHMYRSGGLNGYCSGNLIFATYHPPSKGVPNGPCIRRCHSSMFFSSTCTRGMNGGGSATYCLSSFVSRMVLGFLLGIVIDAASRPPGR